MKKLFTFIAFFLVIFNVQAQVLPELRQYTNGGKIDAEVTIVQAARHFTAYGKCQLRYSGTKLYGNFRQAFSDRNQFMGDKDNTGIEIDMRNGSVTIILNSWGGGKEIYAMQVQPGGKLLVSTNNDSVVAVSLNVTKGQAID